MRSYSGSAPIARDCTRTKKTRAAQSERCALLFGSLLALVLAFVDESRDSDIFLRPPCLFLFCPQSRFFPRFFAPRPPASVRAPTAGLPRSSIGLSLDISKKMRDSEAGRCNEPWMKVEGLTEYERQSFIRLRLRKVFFEIQTVLAKTIFQNWLFCSACLKGYKYLQTIQK